MQCYFYTLFEESIWICKSNTDFNVKKGGQMIPHLSKSAFQLALKKVAKKNSI